MNQHLIKEGDLFLLTDQAGNITKNEDIQYGLYTKDTRFLSSYELFINNIKPLILSSGEAEDNINKIYLTNANFKKIENGKVLIEIFGWKTGNILLSGLIIKRNRLLLLPVIPDIAYIVKLLAKINLKQ